MILLLIDGNSLLHRAYHALPPLTDRQGEPANAVFGFSNMLLKAISEVEPTHMACAFDTQAPTFRHVEFAKYKAQRPPPPPDLYVQLPKVKRVLEAFGIPYFEKEGYEADDIIATIASRLVNSSEFIVHRKSKKTINHEPLTINVVILSGDRDVLQLVDGGIKVQMPGWNLAGTTLYGASEVKEKYGVTPAQMVDYKSLVGDVSDNVPGVSGIGPKTAAGLLQKYGTLDNLFENLDKILEALRHKLEVGREMAIAAKRLVELDRDIDLQFTINDLRFMPDWGKVRREFEELGFKSIAAKLSSSNGIEGIKDVEETKDIKKNDGEKQNSDQLELI